MSILLISGSPRKGNTEYILEQIQKLAGGELVRLRKLRIEHCKGCLKCLKTRACPIKDGMQGLYPKIEGAEVIVIATPNYFENVPGLLKDFIDRTNPFYETDMLKKKKIFTVVAGGFPEKRQKRVIENAIACFAAAHKMKLSGELCFSATEAAELKTGHAVKSRIKRFAEKISKQQHL
jgi:multimeric flavodoxin WrbA